MGWMISGRVESISVGQRRTAKQQQPFSHGSIVTMWCRRTALGGCEVCVFQQQSEQHEFVADEGINAEYPAVTTRDKSRDAPP